VRVRRSRECQVGEREQGASLQNADGIQVIRLDGHLRPRKARTHFDDTHSIATGESIMFEE
jgi:hypothetical protein